MTFTALLESPNPTLTPALVAAFLAERWALREVRVTPLGSTQDQNFRVDAAQGRFVLKVANRATPRDELALQNAAMRHLADAGTGVAVPVPVPDATGAEIAVLEGHLVRLASWVAGGALADHPHIDARAFAVLGDVAASCVIGLADFDDPALGRELQWDPRHAVRLSDELVAGLSLPDDRRAALQRALDPIRALPADGLPVQAVHLDVSDYNIVGHAGPDGEFRAEGVIDVGDVVRTWRVAEAAHASMAAVFHTLADPLDGVLTVVRAFHRRVGLREAEAEALWPVLLARAAVCALSSTHQAALAGESDHLARLMVEDWAALDAVCAVPGDLARAAVRVACDLPALPRGVAIQRALADAEPASVLPGVPPTTTVDLSVTTELLEGEMREWPAQLAGAAELGGGAVGRWGEVRIHHAGAPADTPPATLHLGADLFASVGTAVSTPLEGRVVAVAEREVHLDVAPDGERLVLRLAGIEPAVAPGAVLAAGDPVGTIAGASGALPPHVHVQLCAGDLRDGMAPCREREALLALCPDPSSLIGIDAAAAATASSREAVAHRGRAVADAQRLYYDEPPVILRGAGDLLFDAGARPYVDAVNNVQLVGHSHPHVARAGARALRLFSANSRFLHPDMARYAERLVALLPDELSSVFLVNSGSEAADLALRLARAATGREPVVALEGAYHGWTAGAFAVSTYPGDRPAGWDPASLRDTLLVPQPDPLRGRHGDDAAAYVAEVERACARTAPAAFISEPLLGNQGGIEPPRGFLAGAYAAVRSAGGLCIADEVQVGLGRTGADFWAFEHEGVVPDIVCLAKGLGNGLPLGAVVCRPEIAAALSETSFFSSPGGSPLSCAVGIAVLDVLRDERLQDNARVVGARLRRRMERLVDEHAIAGAVLGRGLFLGLDLVRGGDLDSPADAEAVRISRAALGHGVVIQPTGDRGNVLKLKPPLSITAADVDHLADVIGLLVGDGGWQAS